MSAALYRLPHQGRSQHPVRSAPNRLADFNRLQHAFDALGWNLHPLHDQALLAVHRAWQISTVCHSYGEAVALLRRVRGAPA
jgi:hypothetical protein